MNACHPELVSRSQGFYLIGKVCKTVILKLIYSFATIAKRAINVMQYDSKWASSYANFGIALQFISEWSSGCGFVKLFKKFPRPEDIKELNYKKCLHSKLKLI